MRIIGGHDYYDNALAHGRDDAIVFVREKDRVIDDKLFGVTIRHPRRVGLKHAGERLALVSRGDEYWTHGQSRNYTARIKLTFSPVTAVFCGRVYHGVRLVDGADVQTIHWDHESFERRLSEMRVKLVLESWRLGKFNVDDLFVSYDAPKAGLAWLVVNRVVIAIRSPLLRSNNWTPTWAINPPTLKAVEFYRVFDAYAAFQEIGMFVGGVLPKSANPMVAIADTTRLEKHGFDRVTSFRHRK